MAHRDVYKKEDQFKFDRTAIAAGKGVVEGVFAFKRDDALPTHAIREIVWLTIHPGDSIGYHKHESNEDAYIVISGEGTFTDVNGKDVAIGAGDVTIIRPGQSHGIANTGKELLVILNVIAEK